MGLLMRFDYYAATIPALPTHCEATVIDAFDGAWEPAPPVSPFKVGHKHPDSGLRLYHGGHNPLPFLVASGADAEAASQFMRTAYPSHRVSRADVCEDVRLQDGFTRITSLLTPIARKAGAAVEFMGDPDPEQAKGRTMYYGSRKSDVRIVVYEKGLKERAEGNLEAPEDWVRVELRVRPRKDRKALCASLSASELWGFAKWSIRAAEAVLDLAPTYHPDTSMRESTPERAFRHMLDQYASTLRQVAAASSRAELLARIEAVLDEG